MNQENIKFAHLADLHLGGWREKKMTYLNFKTFQRAIEIIIKENVDFVIFAGDIFNNALPTLDLVDNVTKEIKKLKEKNIPVYVIGGSHDYSMQNNSMIGLLETADILKDVGKWREVDEGKVELIFTKDEKTKTNLTGILGKKKGLDKNIYKNLNEINKKDSNLNIFLFHTTLEDFKPKFLNKYSVKSNTSMLPKGFDFYAGGHIHTFMEGEYEGGKITYPGPLFPNNFLELKRETPSFNLCNFDKKTRKTDIKRIFIDSYKTEIVEVDLNEDTPSKAREIIEEKIFDKNLNDKILLLEIRGVVDGKTSEIGISEIVKKCYEKGAWQVLKNTYKLSSLSLKQSKVYLDKNENVEEKLIEETFENEDETYKYNKNLVRKLLNVNLERSEEEKKYDYEERVKNTMENIIEQNNSENK